ncbi:MAG: FadR family transcriptional regulator [Chelatococcus sp.]|nr:FadR family transcriptional regulator [Chelatococcus sp. YT9]MBX3559711.1 FadR family transcriptional regulator [Chelatococcus sp.]
MHPQTYSDEESRAVHLDRIVPTRKPRLADDLYGQLLLELSRSKYEIGARLPTEEQLAKAFAVSRPIVREALRRLQEDGIVSSRRGAGTFVSRTPPAEVGAERGRDIASFMQAFEVRACLEPEACRLATRRRTPATVSVIARALEDLEAAMKSGDGNPEADFRFHLSIAQATLNDLFVDQIVVLKPTIIGTIAITSEITRARSDERRKKVFREHVDIFSAIERGDEDRAKSYMLYHLAEVWSRITDTHR